MRESRDGQRPLVTLNSQFVCVALLFWGGFGTEPGAVDHCKSLSFNTQPHFNSGNRLIFSAALEDSVPHAQHPAGALLDLFTGSRVGVQLDFDLFVYWLVCFVILIVHSFHS